MGRLRKLFFLVCILIFMPINVINAFSKDTPYIAKWYDDKDGAISLRFDDSLDSHVNTVIPLLNKYNLKATFMVNPGLKRYQQNKDYWEKNVPSMGHRIGNHTMHHSGARTLKEADYEIGAASKIIWALYPNESKLQVFASGGGEKWGGEDWENASDEYKKLVSKYYLIDLYDGNHPSMGAHSKTSSEKLCNLINQAIEKREHQAFTFHNIGNPGIIDYLKALKNGRNLTVAVSEFTNYLNCIDEMKNRIWISPLIQILKYENEYKNTQIEITEGKNKSVKMRMNVKTDSVLYDQKLSLVIPLKRGESIDKVFQNGDLVEGLSSKSNKVLINLEPINSSIEIKYK